MALSCRVLKSKSCEITQEYGGANGHLGTDLVGPGYTVDTVLAHSAGKVVMIQTGQVNNQGSTSYASYGNFVKLDHGNGCATLYAHLANVKVKMGDTVAKGQELGLMGNTGNSYGAHLHFEVFKNNTRTNPKPYLNADIVSTPAPTPTPTPTPKPKFNIGDKVIINGNLYLTSVATSPNGYVSNKTTTITHYAAGAAHPYNTTGTLGWMNEADIKLVSQPVTPPTSSSKIEAGDLVVVNGYGTEDSYGGGKRTPDYRNYTMKVVYYREGRPRPYALNKNRTMNGVDGWFTASSVRKV